MACWVGYSYCIHVWWRRRIQPLLLYYKESDYVLLLINEHLFQIKINMWRCETSSHLFNGRSSPVTGCRCWISSMLPCWLSSHCVAARNILVVSKTHHWYLPNFIENALLIASSTRARYDTRYITSVCVWCHTTLWLWELANGSGTSRSTEYITNCVKGLTVRWASHTRNEQLHGTVTR